MLTRFVFFSSCLYLLVALSACNSKKGCTDPYAINFDLEADKDNGSCNFPALTLHLHPTVGSEEFSLAQNYSINGVDVNFDAAQFYLSGFEIEAENTADSYELEDTYLLVKGSQHMYELGDGRKGTIKNLKLKLGVLEADNHKDPATFEAGHPLGPQTPSMNWSWANGYKFVLLEGTADTDGDGSFETPFIYHLGGDATLADLELEDLNFVLDDTEGEINLKVDFAQFFQNIDIATENVSHGDPVISGKMAANYSDVISKM